MMSYKTILVHLSDQRRARSVLGTALHLARRYNSHLIGLYAYPGMPSLPPAYLPYSAEIAAAMVTAERKASQEVKATFESMTASEPLVAEWRAVRSSSGDLTASVVQHAYHADLVVAGQADPQSDLSPILDFPDGIAMASGRPVLVVPYAGRYPEVGRNVVIAWKPGREAARAVFDALPVLAKAEEVQILEVLEEGEEPDTEIAVVLARHGIKPVVRRSIAAHVGIGDEILSRLADAGADMLVMGAYGHSRMSEFVFGGATRHILQHMTVPTLLSH
jgi:nucleotide-binding universal stress UspA family protein